jgi:hypothetical protein
MVRELGNNLHAILDVIGDVGICRDTHIGCEWISINLREIRQSEDCNIHHDKCMINVTSLLLANCTVFDREILLIYCD